jgi:hypothetical protein
MNDNHSPMSTAGDGVVLFMYNVSLSLCLEWSDRINSTPSVLCSIDLSNGFREAFCFGQSQTRTAYGSHISCMMVKKYSNIVENLPDIISTK